MIYLRAAHLVRSPKSILIHIKGLEHLANLFENDQLKFRALFFCSFTSCHLAWPAWKTVTSDEGTDNKAPKQLILINGT